MPMLSPSEVAEKLERKTNVMAKHFHLVENTGARLIPVMIADEDNGEVGFVLHRKGHGNTKGPSTKRLADEWEAFQLVQFGQFAIRTVCEQSGREALRILGDKVTAVLWTSPRPARSTRTST